MWTIGLALAALSATDALAMDAPAASRATSLTQAEIVVRQLAQGDYRAATQAARLALESAPDDPTVQALAGTLLLHAGDYTGAAAAFERALAGAADDDLACYGLGLVRLAQGDRAEALSHFQASERNGGDKTYLLLARRYTQWLGGAQIALEGAGLPESLVPAQRALEGMGALRSGDRKRALDALEAAQAALPGDLLLQPAGLVMTFNANRPLVSAAPPLPPGNGLHTPPSKERALSGDVLFSPETSTQGVGYLAYELDGKTLTLVNVAPYQYGWNSRQVPNGWHTLTVVLYDAQGQVITRLNRRLRVFNRNSAPLPPADQEQWARVRAELWQALTLRPDRCACAYALGTVLRATGATATARLWFTRAVGLRPDYRDARQQLAACGGLGVSGDGLYGGLPTEKIVALTFDDGPKPGMTEPLVEMLMQQRVPATFFVIGRHVTENPELTRKIAEAGMELANHSYTHRNLTQLSAEEVAREIMQTQAAIQSATGKLPRFLRPPGGNWNGAVAKIAQRWGMTPCFWTVDVYGAEVIGAQQVADAVLAQARPGSIILMHNGMMNTLQALPTIIRELRARGYSFATVDTLAQRLNTAKEASLKSVSSGASSAMRRAE